MTTDRLSMLGRRPRFGGVAAALALVLVLAACNGGEDGIGSASPTTQAGAPRVSVLPDAPPPPDPDVVLSDGIAALAGGYAFTASAIVNDSPAAVIDGRWLDGSSLLTVSSGGADVEYLIAPEGQWARTTEGEWSPVEDAAPVADPLTPLATPTSLELVTTDGGSVEMLATYSASTFGLEGDQVQVRIIVNGGVLAQIVYETKTDGVAARTSTEFRPLTDATPITIPAPQEG